ncbi:eIF2 kinase Gcn2p negative regulator [Pichia californica]|uniref:EIF2 kinase Gcn2p negative regulator n=1 Tax=Pichia californica TaxID=460514 RepID=A0A9P7BE68_9ASCO|nr:eIF2 kinase Gcn2p negative regulator [[Candida] californica]KAG0688967.1 eIF2 kinase Gcn2p negative regulator [[Candida] californica]
MVESEELEQEVGAIEAIYPECLEKLASNIYKFKVPQHEDIIFQMSFPENYPDAKPYVLDVISENDGFDEKYLMELFQEVLDSIYVEGNVMIFDLFTELDAILYTGEEDQEILDDADHWNIEDTDINELSNKLEDTLLDDSLEQDYTNYVYDEKIEKAKMTTPKKSNTDAAKNTKQQESKNNILEEWCISDPITDRKSTFVAFAIEVNSVEEAYQRFADLMEDRKCGRANHAMRAWRIKDKDSGAQYQDCDDDGETAAGGRMLHLMTIMDAWNVMVVCCRWFGGVHIGPDRFKHINSATRDVLIKGGFVTIDVGSNKKPKKKKS